MLPKTARRKKTETVGGAFVARILSCSFVSIYGWLISFPQGMSSRNLYFLHERLLSTIFPLLITPEDVCTYVGTNNNSS